MFTWPRFGVWVGWCVRPPGPKRVRRRQQHSLLSGRGELEGEDAPPGQVGIEVCGAQPRQAGVVAGECAQTDVEDSIAGRGFQSRCREDRSGA